MSVWSIEDTSAERAEPYTEIVASANTCIELRDSERFEIVVVDGGPELLSRRLTLKGLSCRYRSVSREREFEFAFRE